MIRFFTIIVLLGIGISGGCQITITGKLIDHVTREPIPLASISIENTSIGTASSEDGTFLLNVNAAYRTGKIHLSSLGYRSRSISIDSLHRAGVSDMIVQMDATVNLLQEIVVNEKTIAAIDLLNEAINAIPTNYRQEAFNLVMLSVIKLLDSTKTLYTSETELLTYRKGYTEGARNFVKIIQQKISGESPLTPIKDKQTQKFHFPYFPGFNVGLIDMLGSGHVGYTVFDPVKRKKFHFQNGGITYFDKDTVCIIHYQKGKGDEDKNADGKLVKYSGTFFIAINNLAIIRHTLNLGANRIDIIYRNHEGKYFPYSIQSSTPVWDKKKGRYTLTQAVTLEKIVLTEVKVLDNNSENWWPEDVAYDPEYWKKKYGRKK